MPRISIAVKNAVVYFILLVFTSAILGYSIYRISSNKILENATLSLNHTNESVVTQFRMFLNDIQRDIEFISKNPFLHQFISDLDNDQLKSNLSKEFLTQLSTNNHYLQLRLIGISNEGKEIIRAEKFTDNSSLIDDDHLQKKGDRDYFIETIKLPKDSIYFSEINLNQEYGKISLPMVPTMRMAKPIYVNDRIFGIVIANIDLSNVFNELKIIAGSSYNLTLFNDNGYYLIHPDSNKIFGFEFKQPPAIDILQFDNANEIDVNYIHEQDQLYSNIIRYSYPAKDYHLFFSLSADKSKLLSVFNQWRTDIILLTILFTFLSLIIAVWWTQRQTRVFKSLTKTIINFGNNRGDINIHIDRDDEIGDLSKSFQEMANRINLHLKELEIAKTEAIDANKAKQEFLENMSHEIRNPLQSILGMTGMLLQNNPRPDQQVFIETLKFSSENLLTLVNDILDYRKLIHGQIELHYQEINIKEFLDNIIKSHLFEAVNRKIKLSLQLNLSLIDKSFSSDPVRLSQILHNLISNAIRNSNNGKEVILKAEPVSVNKIEFAIHDQGYGLSGDNIQNILQQKQVTGESIRQQNVGLGLPIVINLLKLFKSELEITSQPSVGSNFNFKLHTTLSNAPTTKDDLNDPAKYLSAFFNKVACIEDDIQNAFYYEQIFKNKDIAIKVFNSPEEFKNNIARDYDLIITDLNFAEEKIETYFELLRLSLSENGILIVISGTDPSQELLNNAAFKYDAAFIKPVNAEYLFNKINELAFQKYFKPAAINNLYNNYDHQNEKVKQALELTIREWKDMSLKMIEALQKKDIVAYDKVFHKLINTIRTFELHDLEIMIQDIKIKLTDENPNTDLFVQQIRFVFFNYLKQFEEEL